jgi:transcription elongation GreA/GreB family factor
MSISNIQIGSHVYLRFQNGAIRNFEITKEETISRQREGVLNCDAPLGRALLGHSIGESVQYKVGDRIFSVEIIDFLMSR